MSYHSDRYRVTQIDKREAIPWIKNKHYAARVPSISFSFGLYDKINLVGIVTYGSPPSPPLCIGVCGDKYKNIILELNRLCLMNNKPNEASILISKSLKLLPTPKIIVSFADSSMTHIGYIYQATNWIYTGETAKRTEWRERDSNKHSKTIVLQYSLEERINNPNKFVVVNRPIKHRYIYFLGSRKEIKEMKKSLKYPIAPYPKGKCRKYNSDGLVEIQKKLFI